MKEIGKCPKGQKFEKAYCEFGSVGPDRLQWVKVSML